MTLSPHTLAALVVTGLTGIFFIHVTIYLSVFPSTYLSTYTRHSEMIWAVASVWQITSYKIAPIVIR